MATVPVPAGSPDAVADDFVPDDFQPADSAPVADDFVPDDFVADRPDDGGPMLQPGPLLDVVPAQQPDGWQWDSRPGAGVRQRENETQLAVDAQGNFRPLKLADLPAPPDFSKEDPLTRLARRAEEEAIVRDGFAVAAKAKEQGLTDQQQAAKVALFFGVPQFTVDANLPEWLSLYSSTSNDPRRWIDENPLAARLVLTHPEKAQQVVGNKPLNVAMQAVNTATDYAEWAVINAAEASKDVGGKPMSDAQRVDEQAAFLDTVFADNALVDQFEAGGVPLRKWEAEGLSRQQMAQRMLEQRAQRPLSPQQLENLPASVRSDLGVASLGSNEPITGGDVRTTEKILQSSDPFSEDVLRQRQRAVDARDRQETTEVDSAAAQRLRADGSTLEFAKQRAAEARRQMDVSRLFYERAKAVMAGKDTSLIDSQIAEKSAAAEPLSLNETDAQRVVSESWAGSQSTFQVMNESGLGAALGAATAIGVNTYAKRFGFVGLSNTQAAGWGARIGGGVKAAEATFKLEFGDNYQQLLGVKKDDGTFLSEKEAIGGAVIAASLNTGIELVELNQIRKALGPLGAVAEGGGLERVRELLRISPKFREMALSAGKAWLGEGAEEVSQGAVGDGVSYAMRSISQGKLQRGPVINIEQRKQDFVGGLLGGLPVALGALGIHVTTRSVANAFQQRQAATAKTLADLTANGDVQSMPNEVAQMVTEKSAETGTPTTHTYVDAAAFTRLFQTKEEEEAAAKDLLGEDGPRKVSDAAAMGGKVAVPLADYLGKWGKDGTAQKLASDTATTEGGKTANEIAAEEKANEAWAKKLAADAAKEGASDSPTLNRFRDYEAQLVASGRMSKQEAREAMVPLREGFITLAKRFGQDVEDLFRDVRIVIDDGNQKLMLESREASASQRLSAELADLKPEEAAARVYVDRKVTGLFNFDGWQHEQQRAPAPSVATLTLADIKPVNDAELGGHDTANALLAHIAPAIAAVDPAAARKGTNFIFRGGEAELQRALELVRGLLPEGMQVRGAVGKTAEEALDLNGKNIDKERAAAAEAVTRGEKPTISPDRATSLSDLGSLPQMERAWQAAQAARVEAEARGERPALQVAPTASMQHAVTAMTAQDFFKSAYQDKEVPGVLSAVGWENIPRKAHVASIDLKGLKAVNDDPLLGKKVGDQLLRLFMEVAARHDGSDFDFSHLSGDEFAAQHDDPVKLQAWLAHITAELAKVGVPVERNGLAAKVSPAFRSGIGEKTYGAADRVLNAAKRREKAGGSGVGGSGGGEQRSDRSGAVGGVHQETPVGGPGSAGAAQQGARSANQTGEVGSSGRRSESGAGDQPAGGGQPGEADARAGAPERRVLGGVDDAGAAGGVRPGAGSAAAQGDAKVKHQRRGAAPQGYVQQQQAARASETGSPQRLFASSAKNGGFNGWTDIANEGADRIYRIALTQDFNRSTFLHETGHVFLDILSRLAARADAPQSVRNDLETTLKWFGVSSVDDIKVEQHEQFAKGFEAYLATGEYPSAKLAGPFERFRLWFADVYRNLSTLGRVTDDMRGVFDRLLATDDAIADTKQRMGFKALPNSVLGLSAEEYAAHLDELAQATAAATARIDRAVARDRLRAAEAWQRKQRDNFKKQAAERYEQLPARIAEQLLKGKPAGDFIGIDQPLHRATVEAWLGKKEAAKFRLSVNGLHPDDLVDAEGYALGYATGKDLVTAVAQLPAKEDFVDAQADAEMDANFPKLENDLNQLREMAEDSLHREQTREWAQKEWAALAARATKHGTLGTVPPMAVLQRAAQILANGAQAGHLQQGSALMAERTAANRAEKAALAGDYAQALVFKQQQILQMYLFDALGEVKADVARFERVANNLTKTSYRATLGKASPTFRNAVDLLLAATGIAETRPDIVGTLEGTLTQAEQELVANADTVGFDRDRIVDRLSALGEDETWKDMRVEDVRHVTRALANIYAGALNANGFQLENRRILFETAVGELQDEAKELPDIGETSSEEAAGPVEKLARTWSAIDSSLTKIEVLAFKLSGAKNTQEFVKSAAYRYFIEPIQKAKADAADLAEKTLLPLIEKFEAVPAKTRARWMEKIDGRALFPEHEPERLPTRRFEILVMLLNSGNASNLERLTEGRKITEQQLREAAVAVGVTKEEYAWIQSVWDAADSLRPLAFDIEEQDSGIRPEAIQARPFETPFGQQRGGYFPAVYDREVTAVGKGQATTVADFQDNSFTRPGTSHGFLKQRVDGFDDIISLETSSIQRHFNQVIHDISHRRAVKMVGRLLLSDEVQTLLRAKLGIANAEQFENWLRDVATQRGASANEGVSIFAKWNSTARANIAVQVLGLSIKNAMEDFTSNLTSALAAGDLKAVHLTAAIAEMAQSPFEVRKMVLEKSGEMRSRRDSTQRKMAQEVSELSRGPLSRFVRGGKIGGFLRDHAFFLNEGVEVATGTPIWLGAYRQALAANESEQNAIRFAEATVRQVMVSRNIADLSAIMRNKGAVGSMLMFHGAFNSFFNQFKLLGGRLKRAMREGDAKESAAMSGRILGLSVGLWLIGSVARGQGAEPGEPVSQWLLRKMVLEGFMQMIPGLGEVGNAMAAGLTGKPNIARNNSLFGIGGRIYDSAAKAVSSDDWEKKIQAGLGVAGAISGLPTTAAFNELNPVVQWMLGENEWRNPLDAASDVAYGRRDGQPWNAIQATGDAVNGHPR